MGWMNFLFILFCGFLIGVNISPTNIQNVETIKTLNATITRMVYNTTCFREVNITKFNEFTIIKEQYDNLTEKDRKLIKNLNAMGKCNNIGCSDGYIKCKMDVFDILNIEHPKFSESPSTGGKELIDKRIAIECLPLYNDSRGKYLNLSTKYWWFQPYQYNVTYNLTKVNNTLDWQLMNLTINQYIKGRNNSEWFYLRQA